MTEPLQAPPANAPVVAGVTGTAPPLPAPLKPAVPVNGTIFSLSTFRASSVPVNATPAVFGLPIVPHAKWCSSSSWIVTCSLSSGRPEAAAGDGRPSASRPGQRVVEHGQHERGRGLSRRESSRWPAPATRCCRRRPASPPRDAPSVPPRVTLPLSVPAFSQTSPATAASSQPSLSSTSRASEPSVQF